MTRAMGDDEAPVQVVNLPDNVAAAFAAIDAMRPHVYATNAHKGLDLYATDAILRAMRGCYQGVGCSTDEIDLAMIYLDDNSYEVKASEAIAWAAQELLHQAWLNEGGEE